MKEIKKYDIHLTKLSNKTHEYEFELDDHFFELYSQQIMHGGNLKVHVVLDKSERLLNFTFHIVGTVRVTCDRSLDEFDYPMDIERNLLMRFGEEELELDENVFQILPETQFINLAQHFYDFIGLALPMKKLHPRYLEEMEDEEEDADVDGLLIYSTGPADDEEGKDDDDDEEIDPRWAALKKIK